MMVADLHWRTSLVITTWSSVGSLFIGKHPSLTKIWFHLISKHLMQHSYWSVLWAENGFSPRLPDAHETEPDPLSHKPTRNGSMKKRRNCSTNFHYLLDKTIISIPLLHPIIISISYHIPSCAWYSINPHNPWLNLIPNLISPHEKSPIQSPWRIVAPFSFSYAWLSTLAHGYVSATRLAFWKLGGNDNPGLQHLHWIYMLVVKLWWLYIPSLGLIRYDKMWMQGMMAVSLSKPIISNPLWFQAIPRPGTRILPLRHYMESRSSDLKSKSPPLDVASTVNAVFWCIYWALEDTIGLWWSKLEFAHSPGSSFHREYCQCRNYRTEVEEEEGTVIYRTLLFHNSVFLGRCEKKCIWSSSYFFASFYNSCRSAAVL